VAITLRDRFGTRTHLWQGQVQYSGAAQGTLPFTGNRWTIDSLNMNPADTLEQQRRFRDYGIIQLAPALLPRAGTYTLALTDNVRTYRGNRTLSVPQAVLSFSPSTLAFGTVSVGATRVLPYTLRYSNVGGSQLVVEAPAGLTGTATGQYRSVSTTIDACTGSSDGFGATRSADCPHSDWRVCCCTRSSQPVCPCVDGNVERHGNGHDTSDSH
jgi:hypothetical protein